MMPWRFSRRVERPLRSVATTSHSGATSAGERMGTGIAGASRCRGLDACLAGSGRIAGVVPSLRLSERRFAGGRDHDSFLFVRAAHFGIGEHDLASSICAAGINSLKGKDSKR